MLNINLFPWNIENKHNHYNNLRVYKVLVINNFVISDNVFELDEENFDEDDVASGDKFEFNTFYKTVGTVRRVYWLDN